MAARHSGRLVHVDDARGYGFIESERDAPDAVFLHATQYRAAWPPTVGQSVTYALAAGRRGLRAVDCTPTKE